MSGIKKVVIQIPTVDAEQNIEIDMRIDGKRRTLQYRVEIIEGEHIDDASEEKIDILKRVIRGHDTDWELRRGRQMYGVPIAAVALGIGVAAVSVCVQAVRAALANPVDAIKYE